MKAFLKTLWFSLALSAGAISVLATQGEERPPSSGFYAQNQAIVPGTSIPPGRCQMIKKEAKSCTCSIRDVLGKTVTKNGRTSCSYYSNCNSSCIPCSCP